MATARPTAPEPADARPPVPAECVREWREFLAATRALAERLVRERRLGAPAAAEEHEQRRVEG